MQHELSPQDASDWENFTQSLENENDQTVDLSNPKTLGESLGVPLEVIIYIEESFGDEATLPFISFLLSKPVKRKFYSQSHIQFKQIISEINHFLLR